MFNFRKFLVSLALVSSLFVGLMALGLVGVASAHSLPTCTRNGHTVPCHRGPGFGFGFGVPGYVPAATSSCGLLTPSQAQGILNAIEISSTSTQQRFVPYESVLESCAGATAAPVVPSSPFGYGYPGYPFGFGRHR